MSLNTSYILLYSILPDLLRVNPLNIDWDMHACIVGDISLVSVT